MTVIDAVARARIATDLDSTLFVEAGAGSGKTTSLVGRFVALVLDGTDVTGIAAITFTEAAAAELRARVREAFEDIVAGREVRGVATNQTSVARAQDALANLDRAAISTLHAFAQRLLLSAPVEASLPPRIDVHDEISSALRASERWIAFEHRLLADDSFDVALQAASAFKVDMKNLRALAAGFNQNWDLVVGWTPSAADVAPITEADLTIDVQPLLDAFEHVFAVAETCSAQTDKLYVWLHENLPEQLSRIVSVAHQPLPLLSAIDAIKPVNGGVGGAKDWPDEGKARVRRIWQAAIDQLIAARGEVVDRVLRRLCVELVTYTLADAEARRCEGRLEFHDLLVLARAVLRADAGVRRRLHDRYPRLLIDEFQDTDPIQVELAVRIAADPDHDASLPWDEVDVDEGRLFFVGDPKQSIYRFRRADIDLFARTAARHADGGVRLDTNFRTVDPIVTFCNELFGVLIAERTVEADDAAVAEVAQPSYTPLAAARPALPDDPGPAVLLVGAAEREARAESLRRAEAQDIVGALAQARSDGWLVHPQSEAEPRPCQWSDMAVLVPSRTSLPFLRYALEDAGVPYRLETGSLVYATTEVRDLLAILGAIDDPGDGVSILGALRSPAYGCGDDDLLRWRETHRSFSYIAFGAELDEDPSPVGRALADLRVRHQQRAFAPVPEIVESVVRTRALMASSLVRGGHRDAWRLYRIVIEHARQFADADAGGLSDFLTWAGMQSDDRVRVTVPVLPEADIDAVRILTIHGAKGLEFGITAVSGMSGNFPNPLRGPTVQFRPDGGFDVRTRRGFETAHFEARRTVEDVMGEEEGIRLLYVALTRARDHLIVSVHHKPNAKDNNVKCHAQRIAQAVDAMVTLPAGTVRDVGTSSHRDAHGSGPDRAMVDVDPVGGRVSDAADAEWRATLAEWEVQRFTLLQRSAGGGAVSATSLSRSLVSSEPPDAGDDEPQPESAPWRRGRAGTQVGSAVHAVLQHADLADPTGADLVALATWQAEVEGIPDQAELVLAKATAGHGAALVRRAVASNRWWREVHVGVPLADVVSVDVDPGSIDLFEGFIDLLFQTDDGLVIVDYKTDAVPSAAKRAAALERYQAQGAAYAVAVETAVGIPVVEVHFLFLGETEATVATIENLDEQRQRIRDELARLAGGGNQ